MCHSAAFIASDRRDCNECNTLQHLQYDAMMQFSFQPGPYVKQDLAVERCSMKPCFAYAKWGQDEVRLRLHPNTSKALEDMHSTRSQVMRLQGAL